MKFIEEKEIINNIFYNECLLKICSITIVNTHSVEIVHLLLKNGANNYNECLLELCGIWIGPHSGKIIKLLLEKGANNYNECLLKICEVTVSTEYSVEIIDLLLKKSKETEYSAVEIIKLLKKDNIIKLLKKD